MIEQRYNMRGVSASKEDVHNAIKNIDKGIYPKAFCKIIPDILGGDDNYCNIMHADGAGTKSSLAYIYSGRVYSRMVSMPVRSRLTSARCFSFSKSWMSLTPRTMNRAPTSRATSTVMQV